MDDWNLNENIHLVSDSNYNIVESIIGYVPILRSYSTHTTWHD